MLGNEKGGSGKSTVAMHVAVALMNAGQSVATIDLRFPAAELHPLHRQPPGLGETRAGRLRIPPHHCVARAEGVKVDANEAHRVRPFRRGVGAVEHTHDFIVIDTPGNDTYLMRLAHSMADTLITPLNDSFIDFDVLGTVDPLTFAVTGTSHYAEMIRETRRQRRLSTTRPTDWIVLRNRLSMLGSLNKRLVGAGFNELARHSSDSAAPTGSPSAWSIASSFRAGSLRSTTSTNHARNQAQSGTSRRQEVQP